MENNLMIIEQLRNSRFSNQIKKNFENTLNKIYNNLLISIKYDSKQENRCKI